MGEACRGVLTVSALLSRTVHILFSIFSAFLSPLPFSSA